ncbi:MAG TPA: hypothetical protein VF605_09515 [Allosphingosinicella sp.]|jgi:hypothetical protein
MDSIVTVGTRDYAVYFDRVAIRRCFVAGRLTDDADGRPIAREARIVVDEPLLRAEFSDDSYGIAGDPDVALTDTNVPHNVTFIVSAPDYREDLFTVTVPAAPTGPEVRDVGLRRLPARASGQVLGLTGGLKPTYVPVGGATIDITGPTGPGGEKPLLLAQPLRRDPGPGSTLQGLALTVQPVRIAAADSRSGHNEIVLLDGGGVVAGQLLRFGPPERRHWAQVADIAPDPVRPAPAALVTLVEPLSGSVGAGDSVEPFDAVAFAGDIATPQGPAFAGEAVLWVDMIPAGGDVLALREAGLPDQYYDRKVTSGPGGDYAIRGFARLGSCEMTVTAAGFTAQTRIFPAARLAASPLDWRLIP